MEITDTPYSILDGLGISSGNDSRNMIHSWNILVKLPMKSNMAWANIARIDISEIFYSDVFGFFSYMKKFSI